MEFFWTNKAINTTGFLYINYVKYQNLIVSGKHIYIKRDWGNIIFSGELYSDQNPIKSTENQLIECVENENAEAVANLNGKFVCIVQYEKEVFVLRNQTGYYTPVYYNKDFFSNSFDLIRKSGSLDLELNNDAIKLFLKQGYIDAPKTIFKGINKLSAFEYVKFYSNKAVVNKTLNYDKFISKAGTYTSSLDHAVSDYEKLHKQAILNRIEHKKNISILLSGGFDSGGNLFALRDIYKGDITAFTVGFKNNAHSELPQAKLMADTFNAKLIPLYLDGSEINDLPKMLTAFEEPYFENGMFINYKLTQSINPKHYDVVIGGDGNDQFFGTSSREIALNVFSRKSGLYLFQKLFQYVSPLLSGMERFKFHNNGILHSNELQDFGFSNTELNRLFNDKSRSNKNQKEQQEMLNFNKQYLWRNYFTDLNKSGLQVIIHKASRLSTLAKLNLAFPYADEKILSFLNTLPVKYKVGGSFKELLLGKGQSKFLFKQYLKDKLPSAIANKKKQGGFTPLGIYLDDKAFRMKLYTFIKQTFSEISFFNEKELDKIIEAIDKSLNDKGVWFWHTQKQQIKLMYLLVISMWYAIFVKDDRRDTLSDYFNPKHITKNNVKKNQTKPKPLPKPELIES